MRRGPGDKLWFHERPTNAGKKSSSRSASSPRRNDVCWLRSSRLIMIRHRARTADVQRWNAGSRVPVAGTRILPTFRVARTTMPVHDAAETRWTGLDSLQ